MTPKRTKQSSITSMGFSLLQKPTEMCVGRQIKVLGSFWKGHMSNEEETTQYLCTVRDYHALHKWDTGGTFYEVPDVFLTTLLRNLSPRTGGHNELRYFRCFPTICWCVHRHDRRNQFGRHSIQVPTPVPQERCCLQERNLIHCKDKAVSTTNLIAHVGDLPLMITITDICQNQPKRLDFDNTINLSSLIVSLILEIETRLTDEKFANASFPMIL
jgi:hypothetical protein